MMSHPDEPYDPDRIVLADNQLDKVHEHDQSHQQWHDIQAMFVDDPKASVDRAAQAADAAVAALVESLRQRQAGLTTSESADTEQLRAALRNYRIFWEAVADLGAHLPPVMHTATR